MSDDMTNRGPQDRARINVNEAHELRYWTKELGVTEAQLKEAVNAVGVIGRGGKKASGQMSPARPAMAPVFAQGGGHGIKNDIGKAQFPSAWSTSRSDCIPATTESGVDFDWLDKRSMDPVGYKRINKRTGKDIDKDNIVKGVEYEDGQYVIISPEEIADAYPRTTQTIEIQQFVDAADVSFVYLERPYYVAAHQQGAKGIRVAAGHAGQDRQDRNRQGSDPDQTASGCADSLGRCPLVLNLMRWGDRGPLAGRPGPAQGRRQGHDTQRQRTENGEDAGRRPCPAPGIRKSTRTNSRPP